MLFVNVFERKTIRNITPKIEYLLFQNNPRKFLLKYVIKIEKRKSMKGKNHKNFSKKIGKMMGKKYVKNGQKTNKHGIPIGLRDIEEIVDEAERAEKVENKW